MGAIVVKVLPAYVWGVATGLVTAYALLKAEIGLVEWMVSDTKKKSKWFLEEKFSHFSFSIQIWYKNDIAINLEEIFMAKVPKYLEQRKEYLLKKLVEVCKVIDAHEKEPTDLKVITNNNKV